MTADDILYCGPFMCSEFDLAVGATLVKNPTYWDADAVKVDKVVFHVIVDGSAALNAYEAGEVDRVNLTAADIPAYKDSPEFGTYSDFRNIYLQFNTANPTMNLNIRKALGYAVDRDMLVNVLGTGAIGAGGVVSHGVFGNDENTFRELAGSLSRYDPELAKEYWAKGVEELGGTAPKLTLLAMSGPAYDDVVVVLQDQFRTVLGADVTLDIMTQKARDEIMLNQTYDFALTAWGADYDDAMTWLELWTNFTGYRGNYATEEYKALVSAAMLEPDPAKRLDYMIQAETMLVDTDAVVSGIYDRGFAYLNRASVKGLVYHPVGQPLDLKWAYVE
jgi:oligopeptide transport system substrate-binding protein